MHRLRCQYVSFTSRSTPTGHVDTRNKLIQVAVKPIKGHPLFRIGNPKATDNRGTMQASRLVARSHRLTQAQRMETSKPQTSINSHDAGQPRLAIAIAIACACITPTPPRPQEHTAHMTIDRSVARNHTGRLILVLLKKSFFFSLALFLRSVASGAGWRCLCAPHLPRRSRWNEPGITRRHHCAGPRAARNQGPPPTLPSVSSRQRRGSRPQGTASRSW